jgi:hypothetical protein
MKYLLSIFLITTITSVGVGNSSTGAASLISWRSDYKLTWADFTGTPDENALGDAGTAIRIKAKPYYKGRKLHYDINAYFIPSKSWFRNQSDELLLHEQLHFDLAELYARMARQKVAELQSKNVNDLEILNAAVQQILDESNIADLNYDLETLHGSLPKAQARWEFKTQLELQLLRQFGEN